MCCSPGKGGGAARTDPQPQQAQQRLHPVPSSLPCGSPCIIGVVPLWSRSGNQVSPQRLPALESRRRLGRRTPPPIRLRYGSVLLLRHATVRQFTAESDSNYSTVIDAGSLHHQRAA